MIKAPSTSRGFTILECVAALSILAMVMLLVVQTGYWSMRERIRTASRHAALELASNILESARAGPFETLTPDWAAGQKLPEESGRLLSKAQLTVRVEPEKNLPHTKRVTVEIRWQTEVTMPPQTVQLVGLFSSRSAAATGGKP